MSLFQGAGKGVFLYRQAREAPDNLPGGVFAHFLQGHIQAGDGGVGQFKNTGGGQANVAHRGGQGEFPPEDGPLYQPAGAGVGRNSCVRRVLAQGLIKLFPQALVFFPMGWERQTLELRLGEFLLNGPGE